MDAKKESKRIIQVVKKVLQEEKKKHLNPITSTSSKLPAVSIVSDNV
jgi:hypothetical protein